MPGVAKCVAEALSHAPTIRRGARPVYAHGRSADCDARLNWGSNGGRPGSVVPGRTRPAALHHSYRGAAVPGKARVHELAKEFGVTSNQVLGKAQDLGLYVKSPSSTVEAADARRLRDAFTGRGQVTPQRRTWAPLRVDNSYSPQRPGPAEGSHPRRTPIRQPVRNPVVNPGQPGGDTFAAALRRAEAQSRPPRKMNEAKPSPFVDVILARTPSLQRAAEPTPAVVFEWAQTWIEQWFEPGEVAAWMDAGLKGNEADRAVQLCREGWTPRSWAERGGSSTKT